LDIAVSSQKLTIVIANEAYELYQKLDQIRGGNPELRLRKVNGRIQPQGPDWKIIPESQAIAQLRLGKFEKGVSLKVRTLPKTEATSSLTARINAGRTTFSESEAVPVFFDGRERIFNRHDDAELELEIAVEDFCGTEVDNLTGNEVAVIVLRTTEEEQELRNYLRNRAAILNLETLRKRAEAVEATEEDKEVYEYFNVLSGSGYYDVFARYESGLHVEDTKLRLDELRKYLDKA